jgi:hypothetical protein
LDIADTIGKHKEIKTMSSALTGAGPTFQQWAEADRSLDSSADEQEIADAEAGSAPDQAEWTEFDHSGSEGDDSLEPSCCDPLGVSGLYEHLQQAADDLAEEQEALDLEQGQIADAEEEPLLEGALMQNVPTGGTFQSLVDLIAGQQRLCVIL